MIKLHTTLRVLALTSVLAAFMAGCAGRDATSPQLGLDTGAGSQSSGLPALSMLDSSLQAQRRHTAGLTETLILGKFTFLRSAGALDNGTALQLNTGPASMEWGLYGFDPQNNTLDSVSVALDVGNGSQAWVALADYSKNVWEWHGPLTAGKTFAIDESRYRSPGGRLYCAIAVADGAAATVSALSVRTINPANVAPTASLLADINSGDAPLQVGFDASASSDSDGTIIEYAWDWDDDGLYDGISDQPSATHTFTVAGDWTVRLRVTDEQFGRDSAMVAISVNVPGNQLPSASFAPDKLFADQGSTINFDGSLSDDGDGGLVKYEWDYNGDGEYDSFGTIPNSSHTFSNHGLFPVKLRVTDTVGAQDTYSVAVRINEVFALDSAWPGLGHDDRHTGRSPYIGSQTNSLKWSYTCGVGGVYSSPAIGTDGTIYVGSHDANLYALNPDGTMKWAFPVSNDIYSSPALGPDGTVYFGDFDGSVYAVNPTGTSKWAYHVGNVILSSPVVGPDGIIYIGTGDNSLLALYPDGTLKWSYPTGDEIESSPALGADGTVYAGCDDNRLYAINGDGTLKWSYLAGNAIVSSPAIGPDGTVYVGCDDFNLYAILPDGSLGWAFPTPAKVQSSPALAADGTIYVGCNNNKLYAVHPDGTLAWAYTAGGSVEGSTAIGADGTIYIGSFDNKINAIKPDGTLKFSYATGGLVLSTPAIGADGTVYAGCADNNLYALGTPP